jgi:hypothetical protein
MELGRQGDTLLLHVAAPGAASLALASTGVSALQRQADRPREAANT